MINKSADDADEYSLICLGSEEMEPDGLKARVKRPQQVLLHFLHGIVQLLFANCRVCVTP